MRQIQPVDVESRLGEQVSMPPLPARDIKNAGARRESQQLYETRDFMAIATEVEDGLVFEQVVGVELPFPPV